MALPSIITNHTTIAPSATAVTSQTIVLGGTPATGDVVFLLLGSDNRISNQGVTVTGSQSGLIYTLDHASGSAYPGAELWFLEQGVIPDTSLIIDRTDTDGSVGIAALSAIVSGVDMTSGFVRTTDHYNTTGMPQLGSFDLQAYETIILGFGILDDDPIISGFGPPINDGGSQPVIYDWAEYFSAPGGSEGNVAVMVAAHEVTADGGSTNFQGDGSDDSLGLMFQMRRSLAPIDVTVTPSSISSGVSLASVALATVASLTGLGVASGALQSRPALVSAGGL